MSNPTEMRMLFKHAVLAVAILPIVLMSFQNCAPMSFQSDAVDGPNIGQECSPPTPCPTDPTAAFSLVTHTIRTEMNTAKEWSAPFNGDKKNFVLSLALNQSQNSVTIANQGVLEITDAAEFRLKFTPDFGFRGNLVVWIYALNPGNELQSQTEVKIEVGNSLNFFQPALAVRGSGCIMCHADVRSNIVTDLGYGNDYYFGQRLPPNYTWNFGPIYGDFSAFYHNGSTEEAGNFSLLNHQADKKVFVPMNAAIPIDEPKQKTGANTLAEYLRHRFAASPFSGTRAADKVVERSSIYIGAPTAARIRQAFNWTSGQGNLIYEKETGSGAYELSGLRDGGNYYHNDGTLICEGDVMINGTLALTDLRVRTRTGCRIYATGSVFIYGPITYENPANAELRNLQITSAKAILLGLGDLYNGSTHCEQTAAADSNWYYKRLVNYASESAAYDSASLPGYQKAIRDSAYMRLYFFWPNVNHYVRNDSRAPEMIGKEIYDEMINTIGLQKDAACRVGGRGVGYERLLLNAPRVESRYNGDFVGTIVSEIALMALGQFKFEFDPVFREVHILPKLRDSDYLHIE